MNETEARELLRAAAGTIVVPPGREVVVVEQPRRPRWVAPLAAAVAVVVAIGGAVLLAGRGEGTRVSPAVPPTFEAMVGSQLDAVRRELDKLGYRVRVVPKDAPCSVDDRVLRVAIGTEEVATVYATRHVDAPDCPSTILDLPAWELLDFAAGRGVYGDATWTPQFADQVVVYLDGARTELTKAEASDLQTWSSPGTALSVMRAALTRAAATGGVWETHTSSDGGTLCDGAFPSQLAGQTSLQMTIRAEPPAVGCAAMDVFVRQPTPNLTGDAGMREIYAVLVRTSDSLESSPTRVVPNVIGTSPAEATEILENLGAEVKRINLLAECLEEPGTVAGTEPDVGEPIPADRPVEINVCPAVRNGLTEDDRRIAQRFLDFARGIRPEGGIPTDVPVNLYLGGALKKTISAAESDDPASYVVCTEGYADKTCPFSAIETLRQAGDGVEIADAPLRPAQCAAGTTLFTDHVGQGHSVFLNAVGFDSCIDGFSVQLVYNDVGQINDINLLVGSP